DVARLLVPGIAGQALQHVARRLPGENRHAVIGLLPDDLGVIAEALQLQRRKIAGEAFYLLQAHDVGACLFEPAEQDRQPYLDRIDVEGRDLQEGPRALAGRLRVERRSAGSL